MKALLLTMLTMLLVPTSAAAQSIDKAYQKEFSYLQAQKSALEKRLQSLDRENAAARKTEQSAVDALQGRLVTLQLEGDALQEQLGDLERDATRTDEHSESLLAVFEQARASLERYDVDVKVPAQTPDAAAVRALFERAMPVLDEAGTVRTEPGTFFLHDGRQVEGQITRVGRIAAFGEGGGAHGALAPAGAGHLKIWGEPGAKGIFLFETVDKAVEEKTPPTWLETIEAGGIIAWVIVVLGLFALLLAIWRGIALFLAGTPGQTIDEVCRLVAVGRYAEARRLLSGARGATARVVARTVEVLDERRKVGDDAIAEAILDEQPAIDRFGTAIMVFAAVAPLLGLLGTVTGMIATFDIITEYGTGDPKMLSSGISEALITTQLGLMVAIPALLVGNLLNARAATLLDGLEQAALRILNAARTDLSVEPERAEAKLVPDALPETA